MLYRKRLTQETAVHTRTSMIAAGLAALCVAGAARANTQPPSLPDFDQPVARVTNGGSAICGHVGELMAARSALEVGDQASALVHLKEARRLLSICEEGTSGEEAAQTGSSM